MLVYAAKLYPELGYYRKANSGTDSRRQPMKRRQLPELDF